MGYEEKVPVKFGQLGRLSGLYFGCTRGARVGRSLPRSSW